MRHKQLDLFKEYVEPKEMDPAKYQVTEAEMAVTMKRFNELLEAGARTAPNYTKDILGY